MSIEWGSMFDNLKKKIGTEPETTQETENSERSVQHCLPIGLLKSRLCKDVQIC